MTKLNKDGSILGHRWEKAGWKPPYKYLGSYEKVYQACHGAPIQPAGTCDWCGTGIRHCFSVQDSQGKKFVVGSDCIEHLNDSTLKIVVESELTKIKRQARHEKETATIRDLKIKYEEVYSKLQAQPHPNEYYAKQGRTLADYYDFSLRLSGTSGTIRNLKEAIKRVGFKK